MALGALPLAMRAGPALAQVARPRVVAMLTAVAETDAVAQSWVAEFRSTMRSLGWIEGANLAFEVRWPAGDPARMRVLADEIAALRPDVIVTQSSPATSAVRRAAPNVPNVFTVVGDPLGSGFAASFARPGGRSTGFTNYEASLGAKWLDLLREIAPRRRRFGIVANPRTFPDGFAAPLVKAIRAAAAADRELDLFEIALSDNRSIDHAVATAADERSAMIVMPETSTTLWADAIIAAASAQRIPTIYPYRDYVVRGGLIGYGVDRADLYKKAAIYVDRILRGAQPEALPIQQPTKFEFAINLREARHLGLDVPQVLLALADEVIE